MCVWDHGTPKWCFHSNSGFPTLQVIILWWSTRLCPTCCSQWERGFLSVVIQAPINLCVQRVSEAHFCHTSKVNKKMTQSYKRKKRGIGHSRQITSKHYMHQLLRIHLHLQPTTRLIIDCLPSANSADGESHLSLFLLTRQWVDVSSLYFGSEPQLISNSPDCRKCTGHLQYSTQGVVTMADRSDWVIGFGSS